MKKVFKFNNVVLELMVLGIIANVVSIYLPMGMSMAIAVTVALCAFASLVSLFEFVDRDRETLDIKVRSWWRLFVHLVLFVFMIATSIPSLKTGMHVLLNDPGSSNVQYKTVKHENKNKHFKQAIDREVSKQLDQRLAEMKTNRK